MIFKEQDLDSSDLIDLVGGHLVVSDHLEPYDADPVPPVVVDVLGPGAALDVQQLPGVGLVHLDSHEGALVVVLVEVGEVGLREGSVLGEILEASEALLISGVFTLLAE